MPQSDDLTIVVLVHERRWTLPGLLTYLKKFGGPILVVDSSQTRWDQAGNYPWIEYRHFPGMHIYPKIRMTLESLKTELVLLHPDDDLVLLSAIAACREYMRQHPEVAACQGHLLKFFKVPDGVQFFRNNIGATVSTHIMATETQGSSESAAERIHRLFHNIISINYAVMKREAALGVFEIHDAAPELKLIRFWDKLILFTVAAYGPVAMLDVVYMMRSSDELVRKGMEGNEKYEVPASAIAQMVPPDGGALAAYVRKVAGVDAQAATAIARDAVDRVGQGYVMEDYRRAAMLTQTMAEHAGFRQAPDIQEALNWLRVIWTNPAAR